MALGRGVGDCAISIKGRLDVLGNAKRGFRRGLSVTLNIGLIYSYVTLPDDESDIVLPPPGVGANSRAEHGALRLSQVQRVDRVGPALTQEIIQYTHTIYSCRLFIFLERQTC